MASSHRTLALVLLVCTVALGTGKSVLPSNVCSFRDIIWPQNCPDVCPFIYQPVCAAGRTTPLKTFGNYCSAHMHACRTGQPLFVICNGECPM